VSGKTETINFTVFGTPIPKGSTRSFAVARGVGAKRHYTGQTVSMASNHADLSNYESKVREAAQRAGATCTTSPVFVELSFMFKRPKSHFRTGSNAGLLKPSAPVYHTGKPDIDKLTRAILDGMTGVVFADDSQVTWVKAAKGWLRDRTTEPCAVVRVVTL